MPAADNLTPLDDSANETGMRLCLRGISKSFGATKALDGVDLEIAAGEVHAIIGENGAGKSTLMKVLSGALAPDAGEIRLDGRPLQSHHPRQSIASGIAMIYQELNLAPDLTVAENIVLGDAPGRLGWIDGRRQREIAQDALAKLHCDHIDIHARVETLSIAAQQMVEIARAVRSNHLKVLILDEPTSSLTRVDTEHLFEVIERLRDQGVSIVYISHFLEECSQIADRFTVLRDGKSVGSGQIQKPASHPNTSKSTQSPVPMSDIIEMMVGRDVSQLYPTWDHQPGDAVLEYEVDGSSVMTLHRGQIFGIAGLIGAGRTELVRGIFGLDAMPAGSVQVLSSVRPDASIPRDARSSWQDDAMGLVSEDRKNEGLLLDRSLTENMTLTRLHANACGWVNDGRLRQATQAMMNRLKVKAESPDQTIGDLSGGNQQKIAMGRLLHHECEILLLDEPTRGIDIGSKQTIYDVVGELAAAGKAILVVSSYLPELMGICDTIGVMSRGQLVDVRPTPQWTEPTLLAAAIGQDVS